MNIAVPTLKYEGSNFSTPLPTLVISFPVFFFFFFYYNHPEKAMASHSSTLAWKIPWTEEPGGLQSMGSLGVGHD